jgi:hypothetical protein
MAAQNVKDMPLRRIVGERITENDWRQEVLECGHADYPRRSGLGYATRALRRRCWQCLRCQECGEAVYEHEAMARNADGFWHADCANAPL